MVLKPRVAVVAAEKFFLIIESDAEHPASRFPYSKHPFILTREF
jgi:hypothetical protein